MFWYFEYGTDVKVQSRKYNQSSGACQRIQSMSVGMETHEQEIQCQVLLNGILSHGILWDDTPTFACWNWSTPRKILLTLQFLWSDSYVWGIALNCHLSFWPATLTSTPVNDVTIFHNKLGAQPYRKRISQRQQSEIQQLTTLIAYNIVWAFVYFQRTTQHTHVW